MSDLHTRLVAAKSVTPQRALDLDAIRARHHKAMTTIADIIRYGDSASVNDAAMLAVSQSAADVPALEDEVTALRAELDAARAERTEPATGEERRGQAVADVELIARTLSTAARSRAFLPLDDSTAASDDEIRARQKDRDILYAAAEQVLAALDLPGRERALREEIEVSAHMQALDAAEYGYRAEYNRLTAERDAANERAMAAEDKLAVVETNAAENRAAIEALHQARDNTAALLEEARARLASVAAELRQTATVTDPHLAQAYRIAADALEARQNAGGEGGGS